MFFGNIYLLSLEVPNAGHDPALELQPLQLAKRLYHAGNQLDDALTIWWHVTRQLGHRPGYGVVDGVGFLHDVDGGSQGVVEGRQVLVRSGPGVAGSSHCSRGGWRRLGGGGGGLYTLPGGAGLGRVGP